MGGWIAVDLDGTLAEYVGWKSAEDIGPPIAPMVARVKKWLSEGQEVRIFTARVTEPRTRIGDRNVEGVEHVRQAIERWCKEHIGVVLPVTNIKDFGMVELWDDRAIRVRMNVGEPCCSYHSE